VARERRRASLAPEPKRLVPGVAPLPRATRGPAALKAPLHLATRAAHAGTSGAAASERARGFAQLGPAGETAHGLPLYQTSNYAYPDAAAADAAAAGQAFLYSRQGNPTIETLEAAMADLEGGEQALAFASGMAAAASVLFALGAGGEVLASEGIYGGTTELLRDLGPAHGIATRFVPAWDSAAVAASIGPRTRILLIESLTNPLLRVPDLPALAALARRRGVALVVDATFTPTLCRPLALGATAVVHSVSKYVGGHGDLIGGVAVGAATTLERVRQYRTLLGGVMDPLCAWLALRGLRTLPLRMERQCLTAMRLARALGRLRPVRAVHHPGLRQHPDHLRARRLLAAPGAMVAFELRDGRAARRFYNRVRVVTRAASLGEVSSLLTHPASFSHKGLPPSERARLGIHDGLLRLSVGLEDPRDLEADIRQALEV
jgi:cystathionine beta-lyase/cystathionine gamma-synthase